MENETEPTPETNSRRFETVRNIGSFLVYHLRGGAWAEFADDVEQYQVEQQERLREAVDLSPEYYGE